MNLIRALIRAIVIAIAIWIGQLVIPYAHHSGIWAMVSLGIAGGLLGALFTRSATRGTAVLVNFLATAVVIGGYFMLLPQAPGALAADLALALMVGAVSGFIGWFVPRRAAART